MNKKFKEYKNKKWDQEVQKKLRIVKEIWVKDKAQEMYINETANHKTNHKLNSELSQQPAKKKNMMKKIQDTRPII